MFTKVFIGTVAAFIGTVAAFIGTVAALIGTVAAFIGTVAALIGTVAALIGRKCPQWCAFYEKISISVLRCIKTNDMDNLRLKSNHLSIKISMIGLWLVCVMLLYCSCEL